MIIKEYSKLSAQVIEEILKLESACKKQDKLTSNIFLDNSLNFNPNINSTFLLYEDTILISVLTMFVPTQNEAEISGFTLFKYRRMGFFKKLFKAACSELTKYGVHEVLFVCEKQSVQGRAVIKKLEGDYDFTEYSLKYNRAIVSNSDHELSRIKLHKPNIQEVEILVTLMQQIFNDSYKDAKCMVKNAFESKFRDQYLAVLDEEFIGVCGVSFESDGAYIFGFGIEPKYQGKGFGKDMLKLVLDDLIKKNVDVIMIDVNSTNERAYNLYKKYGFTVQTAIEYYRKEIK